jgi:hypothetical protein
MCNADGEGMFELEIWIPYTQIFSRLKYLAVRPSKYLFAGNNIRN